MKLKSEYQAPMTMRRHVILKQIKQNQEYYWINDRKK